MTVSLGVFALGDSYGKHIPDSPPFYTDARIDYDGDEDGDDGDAKRRRMRNRKKKRKNRLSVSFGAMRLKGRGSTTHSVGNELRELTMELADTLSLWMDEYNQVKKLAQDVYKKWDELKKERKENPPNANPGDGKSGLKRTTASLKVRRVLQAPPKSGSSSRDDDSAMQLGVYGEDSTVFSP